jgi:hypothetical protein
MEAIKQIVRTPRNHEILIKIPRHVPENDLVEIILIVKKKQHDFERKINELKGAMSDELFLSDLTEVSDEFEKIDLAEWE